jgi:predicted CXXCH cytochrome family protein
MRRSILALVAGAACACAAPRAPAPAPEQGPTAAELARVVNPHDTDGKPYCASCHPRAGSSGLRGEPVALCRSCHALGHGNHPVDVVQAKPAAGLPLLAGNRVACHTCHDPHDMKTHGRGLRRGFNDLCTSCHPRAGRAHH